MQVDASSSDWYSAVGSLSPNKHGGNSQHLVMHVFSFFLERKALGGRYNAVVAGVPVSVAILGLVRVEKTENRAMKRNVNYINALGFLRSSGALP